MNDLDTYLTQTIVGQPTTYVLGRLAHAGPAATEPEPQAPRRSAGVTLRALLRPAKRVAVALIALCVLAVGAFLTASRLSQETVKADPPAPVPVPPAAVQVPAPTDTQPALPLAPATERTGMDVVAPSTAIAVEAGSYTAPASALALPVAPPSPPAPQSAVKPHANAPAGRVAAGPVSGKAVQEEKDSKAVVMDTPAGKAASATAAPPQAQVKAPPTSPVPAQQALPSQLAAPAKVAAPSGVSTPAAAGGRVVGPTKEVAATAAAPAEVHPAAPRITVVDIDKSGNFALITNPQTRLPEKVTVGQKLFTGETVKRIDPASGAVQLDTRTISMQ
jgi:hypothetical protein